MSSSTTRLDAWRIFRTRWKIPADAVQTSVDIRRMASASSRSGLRPWGRFDESSVVICFASPTAPATFPSRIAALIHFTPAALRRHVGVIECGRSSNHQRTSSHSHAQIALVTQQRVADAVDRTRFGSVRPRRSLDGGGFHEAPGQGSRLGEQSLGCGTPHRYVRPPAQSSSSFVDSGDSLSD